MSTNIKTAIEREGGPRVGVSRSEPGGRAQRDAGGAGAAGGPVEQVPDAVRERLGDELIDEMLAGAGCEEEIVGPGGLLGDLTRRLVERGMDGELTEHLGYEPGQPPPGGAGNTRNATTPKTLASEHGQVQIQAPRDRKGSFAPQIVPKGKRRFAGFDEKIIALYARGMSVRDIQAHLAELYGVEVGHDVISRVTDAVIEDVRAWQQRRSASVASGACPAPPFRAKQQRRCSVSGFAVSRTDRPCGTLPALGLDPGAFPRAAIARGVAARSQSAPACQRSGPKTSYWMSDAGTPRSSKALGRSRMNASGPHR
jgi:hypothetical protein